MATGNRVRGWFYVSLSPGDFKSMFKTTEVFDRNDTTRRNSNVCLTMNQGSRVRTGLEFGLEIKTSICLSYDYGQI